MIERWKRELTRYGFGPKPGNRRTLVRVKIPFEQAIFEGSHKFDKASRAIHLGISIQDRYLSDPTQTLGVALLAYLRPEGVAIAEHGATEFWPGSEEAALETLRQYGLPWLDQYSDAHRLITYFEGNRRTGIPKPEPPTGLTPEERRIREEVRVITPPVRRPPISNYFLALLYDAIGDREQACKSAEAWLGKCRGIEGEPDRTLRQLAQMGCPGLSGA
jgi:hypothetical protein